MGFVWDSYGVRMGFVRGSYGVRMAFRPVRGRVAQRATILVAPHEDRVSGRCVGYRRGK